MAFVAVSGEDVPRSGVAYVERHGGRQWGLTWSELHNI